MGQIFEIFGTKGRTMVPLTSEGKDDLPLGTKLRLNGYDCPEYIIVANQGTSGQFAGYGARYVTVNPDKLNISIHDAYSLKWWADKQDDRIQIYIMPGEPMDPEEVKALYVKAQTLDGEKKARDEKAKQEHAENKEKGKALIEATRPPWAKAVIVAYQEFDDCDMMSDYFNTKSGPAYLLAWSKHTRDLFPEMRKAAARKEETEHLGPRKGLFKPRIVMGESFQSNGAYYHEGNNSHWHSELEADEGGNKVTFTTKEEAEEHTKTRDPHPISFEGQVVNFKWEIFEEEIEHREKYSMGAGYYLKAAHHYSTGWKVVKWSLNYYMDAVYHAAGEGRSLL